MQNRLFSLFFREFMSKIKLVFQSYNSIYEKNWFSPIASQVLHSDNLIIIFAMLCCSIMGKQPCSSSLSISNVCIIVVQAKVLSNIACLA